MILALGIGVPPSSHFIYIPVMFILGIVLGFLLGSKATRDALAFDERRSARNRRQRRQASAAESPK